MVEGSETMNDELQQVFDKFREQSRWDCECYACVQKMEDSFVEGYKYRESKDKT